MMEGIIGQRRIDVRFRTSLPNVHTAKLSIRKLVDGRFSIFGCTSELWSVHFVTNDTLLKTVPSQCFVKEWATDSILELAVPLDIAKLFEAHA